MKIFALLTSKSCCEDEIRARDNAEREREGEMREGKRHTVNVFGNLFPI